MCAAGQRIKNVFLPDCTVWSIVKRPGRFGNGFLLSRKEVPPVYARPPFFFFRFPSVLILLSPRSALSPCVRMLDELPTDELLPQLFCIFTMSGTSNLILLALLSRPKALIVRWELGRKKVRKKKKERFHISFVLYFAVVHGADQSVWHIERSQAYGRCRALAGLSPTRVLRAERPRKDGRTARDAVHGSGQDHQTVVAVLLHRIRSVAAVRGHWAALSRAGRALS